MDPTQWNQYVFLAALVPAISAVYAGTRFEQPYSIVINAIRLSFSIFGTLALITAILVAINAW
ncbi:hypothetical protein GC170_18575 [bacterium]|nr:hypothetical protein [bacterium]